MSELDIRASFPALGRGVHGRRLAFLDSAASAQKPQVVLDAMAEVMMGPYANIHRGLYYNSAATTAAFEAARGRIAQFVKADPKGLIFVRNATEGVNLVAQSWGRDNLQADDIVVLTQVEHHANIVPWQLLQAEIGFTIRVIPIEILENAHQDNVLPYLEGAKLLALTQMSNVTGLTPNLGVILAVAKACGCVTLVDGSQAVVHQPVDLQALGADFYVFTGHKLYGPTGIGILWGKPKLLENMRPYQGGGDMIDVVKLPLGTTFAGIPARFEAGTPAIAEAIGLAKALDFMEETVGWARLATEEARMVQMMQGALKDLDFVEMYGGGDGYHGAIAAFNVKGAHHSDVATLLDQQGVAVRSGHHCAMPYMTALGIDGCVRASLGVYSNAEDIDQLVGALKKAHQMLV